MASLVDSSPLNANITLTAIMETNESYIGKPGTAGFGVGVAPDRLLEHLGFSKMEGTTIATHPNFGNYVDSKNNVYVFIPAFCYSFDKAEIGNEIAAKSPAAFAIKSFSEFNYDEAKANKAKYILHRAFIDGGEAKEGFFITKYLVSKGNKSVKNAVALVLEEGPNHSDASSKDDIFNPDCDGDACDAITIAKKMTNNKGNCASIFMYSALAMLSFVHGLHATSKDNCAWWDDIGGSTNYPKGCNNTKLGDNDDLEIKYKCDDTLEPSKGNTGGANHFERTTHNGQACGIADLNGLLEEVALGVIAFNVDEVPCKLIVMKETTSLTSFTKDNVSPVGSINAQYEYGVYPPSIYETGDFGHSHCFWGHYTENSFFTDYNGINRAYCGVFPSVKQTDVSYLFNSQAISVLFSPHYASLIKCGGYFGTNAPPELGLDGVNGSGLFTMDIAVHAGWKSRVPTGGFRVGAYAPHA